MWCFGSSGLIEDIIAAGPFSTLWGDYDDDDFQS